MHRISRFLVPLAAMALLVSACGSDDSDSESAGAADARVVEVEMRDIAFAPTSIEVTRGENVRFVFTNTGAAIHEAYLGDAGAQRDHAGEMSEMDGMHGGAEEGVVIVDPGEKGELVHRFDDSGTVQLGCHQPGHYEAGMVLDVTVLDSP